ncbi:MAG: alpha-amylase family glycosyl hydrolase [Nostoc sp. CreGUA01]|nr:alpha-amylase family glycosyl hydrolase [Nostoc sp. CreGUA01]
MFFRNIVFIFLLSFLTIFNFSAKAFAAEQPVAIFHAFNQQYSDVQKYVCTLAEQGYSHVQISPAQKSKDGSAWYLRYQPVDYSVIEGLGSETDLKNLASVAHNCNVKVIADVVFNHMADFNRDLTHFPNLSPQDFNTPACDINYHDGNRDTETRCWLGSLPDLKFTDNVKTIQKNHLTKLLNLGVDGFRFDAAKHMPPEVVQEYINYINEQSAGKDWNYLEVIEDFDTKAEDYNWIAAVEDFNLYNSIKGVFSFGGDLRSLPTIAVNDPRSVTFGANHDTIRVVEGITNNNALNPYDDITDSYLATAYVLARESGTPLIFNEHNLKSPYIKFGTRFRQIMTQRGQEGKNVKENILRVVNDPTVLIMERGAEGLFVENKGAGKFDIPALNLTLTNLEGCYRELRNNFTVAIEKRDDGKKYITRWGTWNRGGMEVQARDALYFIREQFSACQ